MNLEGTTTSPVTFRVRPALNGVTTDFRRYPAGTPIDIIHVRADGTAFVRVTGTRYEQTINLHQVDA